MTGLPDFAVVLIILIVVCVFIVIMNKTTSTSVLGGVDAIEYEYRFPLKPEKAKLIRKKLKEMEKSGLATHTGAFLMNVTVYNPANDEPLPEGHARPYYRIRREGNDKATKTVKTGPATHRFEEEEEFHVSEMPQKHQEMLDQGFTVAYNLEKIRDLWNFPGIDNMHEVVFDQIPGIPEYMEIDATSEEGLLNMMRELQVDQSDRFPEGMDEYKYYYDVPSVKEGRKLPDKPGLVFDKHAKDQFKPYLSEKKSKEFDRVLKEQIAQAKKFRA